MSEEKKDINVEQQEEEKSINFMQILKDLRKYKKKYIMVLAITFVLTAIYALGLPNYYQCTVKLSPEMTTSRSGSSGLAAWPATSA